MGLKIYIGVDKMVLISETDNLLLNMMSGLLPENLTKHECDMLKERFGNNWFIDLGYNDIEYKRPNEE